MLSENECIDAFLSSIDMVNQSVDDEVWSEDEADTDSSDEEGEAHVGNHAIMHSSDALLKSRVINQTLIEFQLTKKCCGNCKLNCKVFLHVFDCIYLMII